MKKLLPFLVIFMMFSGVLPALAEELVYQNQYGKLTVYPDTSMNVFDQVQYCNLTWYKPDNTIDVAFRFDNYLKGGRIEFWNGNNWKKVSMKVKEFKGKVYYYHKNFNVQQDVTYHFRLRYTVDIGTRGKWDFIAKLSSDGWKEAYQSGRYVLLDPWWDTDWIYKKLITIDHNQIPKNLKNFPVLINITDADLQGGVGKDDGGDIAFVDSSETNQYNHEIEYFNHRTGQLRAWVNITTLSSSVDTDIYMYYGNDNPDLNASNPSGVWDSNYIGVYHFEGDTWDDIDDSTSYNNDAVSNGGNPEYNYDCFFGRGIYFDGVGDYISLADGSEWTFKYGGNDNKSQIETVVKTNIDNTKQGIFSKYPTGTGLREWYFIFTDANEIRYAYYDETHNAQMTRDSTSILKDKWYYFSAAYNSSNPTSQYEAFELYGNSQNITEEGNKAAGYVSTGGTITQPTIGRRGTSTSFDYLDGMIEELRVTKNIVRNDSWVTATYNTMWNATDGGFFTLDVQEVTSDVGSPLNFTATTDKNDGTIDLTWDLGLNASHTLIEWNTIYLWAKGSGTEIYNDTDNSTTFSSVSCGIIYYFRAWSYNITSNNWSSSSNSSNISCPANPTNIATASYPTAVNFTWTVGDYADTTLVVRKSGSYPANPSDGTILYNGTHTWYNDTTIVYGTHKYTLFSFNNTIDRFSTGVQATIGSIRIGVYDENTSLPLSDWSILISNQAGDTVYVAHNCNNILTIDNTDLPTGLVSILINVTGYESRIYYATLEESTPFFLSAFLPEVSLVTNYYVIQVINEENNEVSDVNVVVSEYDNTTDKFQEVSSLYTDGYGQVGLYLIGGKHYKVNLTKDGYETVIGADYFPDPNYYGIYYPKIFKMYFVDIHPHGYIDPSDIRFGGSRHSQVGETIKLFIWGKSIAGMDDMQIYVIGYNASSGSYLASSFSYTDTDIFYRNISNANIWDSFKVKIYFNHTDLKHQLRTFFIVGNTSTFANGFDTFLPLIIGNNPFGWSNLIIWLLLLMGCYYTDGKYAGEIMILLGGLFLFINAFIMETTLATVAGGLIPTLFILIGIIAMWGEAKRKKVRV